MPNKNLQFMHISTGTIIRLFLIIFGIILIYIIRDILTSLLFAVIIASALEPSIEWLKSYKVPRIAGVVLIYVAIGAALFFSLYLVFPLFFDEFKAISSAYPSLQTRLITELQRVDILPFGEYFRENVEGVIQIPAEFFGKLSGGVINFASVVFGGVFSFFLIIVFSFYLATQEKGIESFLRLIAPAEYEPYLIDLWHRSQRKLGRWVRAQMLLGAIVGVLIFFGLTILGLEHAMFFAILAALFEVIPVVGPILAAVPAVLIAAFISPTLAIWVVILYVVVQQLESHVIVPVVMRTTIGLSPLIVVLALLIGAKIGGIFGILLSVPLTAIGAELINDWDKKKRALIPE